MTRTELIVQLLKVAIGLAFGAYFVWWSLEVLDRLAPENEEPTPAVGRMVKVHAAPEGSPWMWTLALGHHEDRSPTHGYEATREAAIAVFTSSGTEKRCRQLLSAEGTENRREVTRHAEYYHLRVTNRAVYPKADDVQIFEDFLT
jgi:hypothetical protein